MADNILTTDRAAAPIDIAAKDIAGVLYPRNIIVKPDGTDITPLTDESLRAAPVPVSAAALPLPTGAATEVTLASVLTALGLLVQPGDSVQITGTVPLPTGAATEATLDARTGALTETAPATDTASSGINGRLQRIAQRLTSLIGLLPASLGPKPGAASLSVAPASDVVFQVRSAAGSLASISGTVTAGGTAQNAAAANSGRVGFSIQNQSSGVLWFSTLATAVASQPSIKLLPGAYYESPPGGAGTGALSVLGATTGQAWAGREW